MSQLLKEDTIFEKALKKYNYFTDNEDLLNEYDKREAYLVYQHSLMRDFKEEGFEEGIEKGKLEGIKERNYSIAKDMKAENIDIDDIYKVISTDTTEVKLEKDGKQNVSFFIDAYSTEILVSCIGKSLNNDFIEYNLNLLNNSNYKLDNVILHSDRGGMYKSGIYNTKTAEMNLIPSMSAPYTYTHNPWIETLNGQFKDFIKNNYPKSLDELQIALKQIVYYNNNIKIKGKLKTTSINYRCSHS